MSVDLFETAAPQVEARVIPERISRAAPAPAAAAGSCGTCGESTPWILSGNGEDSGFVDCTHMRAGHRINARAGCAFTPARWKPIDVKKLAQRAINQAVAAADRASEGWSDRALDFIKLFVASHQGKHVTGYEIVQRSVACKVEQPQNPRAWGGPIQRAARLGLLVKHGTVPDPNPERHGSDVPLWECCP